MEREMASMFASLRQHNDTPIRRQSQSVTLPRPSFMSPSSSSSSSSSFRSRIESRLACALSEINGRDYMEDYWVNTELEGIGHLWGVFDGHGGDYISRALSQMLPGLLHNRLHEFLERPEQWSTVIRDTILSFDRLAFEQRWDLTPEEKASLNQRTGSAGSTLLLALLSPRYRRLWLVNVGDSRAVLYRASDGQPIVATVDHSPEDPEERQRVLSVGGSVTRDGRVMRNGGEDSLAVSRAIGDFNVRAPRDRIEYVGPERAIVSPLPDITEVNLDEENTSWRLVLASDGLWENSGRLGLNDEGFIRLVGLAVADQLPIEAQGYTKPVKAAEFLRFVVSESFPVKANNNNNNRRPTAHRRKSPVRRSSEIRTTPLQERQGPCLRMFHFLRRFTRDNFTVLLVDLFSVGSTVMDGSSALLKPGGTRSCSASTGRCQAR